jgi:hypothetical protein
LNREVPGSAILSIAGDLVLGEGLDVSFDLHVVRQ